MNKIKIALNLLKGCLKKYANKHLHLKYKELWKNNLFNDSQKSNSSFKFRTDRLFTNQFNFEPYLHWGNYDKRRLITKFRIKTLFHFL